MENECVNECAELSPITETLEYDCAANELVYNRTIDGVDYPLSADMSGVNVSPGIDGIKLTVPAAIDTTGPAGSEVPGFDTWSHIENVANPVTPEPPCEGLEYKLKVYWRSGVSTFTEGQGVPIVTDRGTDVRTFAFVNGSIDGCGGATMSTDDAWAGPDHIIYNSIPTQGQGIFDAAPPGQPNSIDVRNIVGHLPSETRYGTWDWAANVQWEFVLVKA